MIPGQRGIHRYTYIGERGVTGTNADLTLARGSGLLAEMHFSLPFIFLESWL